MPPPKCAEFPEIVLKFTTAEPCAKTPPPAVSAVFCVSVLRLTSTSPFWLLLPIAPPKSASFFENMLPVTVALSADIPPPTVPAELSETVLLVMLT